MPSREVCPVTYNSSEKRKRFRLETLAPRGNGRLLSYHERQVEKNKNKKTESKTEKELKAPMPSSPVFVHPVAPMAGAKDAPPMHDSEDEKMQEQRDETGFPTPSNAGTATAGAPYPTATTRRASDC